MVGIDTALQNRIVAEARSWIGTPYHHQAATKGAGCDCLGLVRGIYAEVMGKPSEDPPPYSQDWGDATGEETLLLAAARHLHLVPRLDVRPGDVLVFRMREGRVAKHCAILSAPGWMIHACEAAPVCEVPLGPWRHKLAAVFRFPEMA
jgi:NlpC/P60 family putative phage cell wall peptidase